MRTTRRCIVALLLTWTALLPRAAGAADRWVHLGPFGGTVSDVVVAPSAPRTLYASAMGLVYRSDDAGGHWHLATAGLPLGAMTLAVDPSDARIVYAGRGTVLGQGEASLFKTVDGGATWVPLSGPASETISAIAIDPHDPSRLLAAGYSHLFRSEDGGATWEAMDLQTGDLAPLFYGVAFDPVVPGVAYAAAQNEGFLKSTDGGVTWTKKAESLGMLWRMAVSPAGVVVVVPIVQYPAPVFRSLDHGETWDFFGSIPNAAVFDLAFSPSGTLLAGTTRGVFRKDAIGTTWTSLRPNRREEILALAADPVTDGTFYAGLGDFGGFRGVLATPDSGATWTPANQGLGGVGVYSAAIAASDPDVIYASLVPSGAGKSTDGGITWQSLAAGASSLYHLLVDPRDEDVVYGAGGYGVFVRTTNGGQKWTHRQIRDGQCVSPQVLTLDPRHPDDLFLAGFKETGCERQHEDSCHTLETSDGGRAWDCLEGARSSSFFDLVVDPRHSSTLYAAAPDGVYRSTDGGATWTRRSAGLPLRAILELVIAPNGTLWASTRDGLFRSGDRARTWRRTGRGLPRNRPITELVLAPSDSKVLYAAVATEDPGGVPIGVDLYVSTDRGATWRRLPEDGLLVDATILRVDPRDAGRIYAGTDLGLYRLDGADE
jgi:photosystem II stability/assembly factor-like uncharacterized protein